MVDVLSVQENRDRCEAGRNPQIAQFLPELCDEHALGERFRNLLATPLEEFAQDHPDHRVDRDQGHGVTQEHVESEPRVERPLPEDLKLLVPFVVVVGIIALKE